MTKKKLDTFETAIEADILNYKEISSKKKYKIQEAIHRASERKNISLRVNAQDLGLLKSKAVQEGIPYQTLISSVLHKFAFDQLVDQTAIIKTLSLIR